MAGYQPRVYREQGGARQVIASGGALDVESGGEIDIESGGAFKIAGTAVSLGGNLIQSFTFATTSPLTIGTIPAGKRVKSVTIVIDTTFDGTAPTLQVGDAGSAGRLHATTSNDPKTGDSYTTTPWYLYAAATAVILTITPDSSAQGAGVVVVEFI